LSSLSSTIITVFGISHLLETQRTLAPIRYGNANRMARGPR
jgi:hypothetical protein